MRTVERARLWRAQTPQGFPRDIIERAHVAARAERVDRDRRRRAVSSGSGMPVVVVRGSERAMKITDEADFARAEALLRGAGMSDDAPVADPVLVARGGRGGARAGTIAHLKRGGVLAYPTETVYGFGGAVDRDSVERWSQLKRPAAGQAVPAARSPAARCSRGSTCTCPATRRSSRRDTGPAR